MVNYQNAKIYRLVCDDTNLVYYGATTQKLCKRLAGHKSRRTCTSRYLFEVGNVQIFLVENFPCNSKEELDARERYYIENNECVNKQYDPANIEYRRQKKEEWRKQNKEHINTYHKRWRDLQKMCL
jgi:predicted GIY-YIG superfamily endonuclease